MKNLITVLTTFLISAVVLAQGSYEDLLILKADGSWEKLIKKAESYTTASKTKKDAEPFYYLTYGLYKISFDAERGDKYKNAYKESFTSAGKMIRLDQSGEIQEKYGEFIDELKLSLLEIIENDLDNEEYRKAFGWVMRLYKFGRDYAPVYFLEAALRYRNDDPSTARTKWEAGEKLLKEQDADSFSKADLEMLKVGLYQSAKVLKENLQQDKAKEFMDIGSKLFKDSEMWDEHYNEIIKSQ